MDEDAFVLPAEWSRLVVPRRPGGGVAEGGGAMAGPSGDAGARSGTTARGPRTTAAVAPAAGSVEAARSLLAENAAFIRQILTEPATDPDLAEAGLAHLEAAPSQAVPGQAAPGQAAPGQAAPAQAARPETAVGAAAAVYPLALVTGIDDHDRLAVFADAWFLTHGPVFAADAVLALHAIAIHQTTAHRFNSDTGPLKRIAVGVYPHSTHALLMQRVAHRLRALLVALPDGEYADVRASLERQRHGLPRRVAASVLAPENTDWVTRDAADVGVATWPALANSLLFAVSTPEQFRAIENLVGHDPRAAPTIVDGMGAGAADVIAAFLDAPCDDREHRRSLAAALAQVPGDAAFQHLIARAGDPTVKLAAMAAVRRFPNRAKRLLAHGPEDLRRMTEHPDTPRERLPEILQSPPWLRKRKGLTVLGVGRHEAEPTIHWLAGERQERRPHDEWYGGGDTWEERAALLRNGILHTYHAVQFFDLAPDDIARPLLRDWRTDSMWNAAAWGRRLAARFELDALPALLDLARRSPAAAAPTLMPFASPEIAVLMADWAARLKAVRPVAQEWLVRHAAIAARTLVPLALTKPTAARRTAEGALRFLVLQGQGDAVRTAAAHHGSAASTAIDDLIRSDPAEALPAQIPAVPDWADPAALHRIRLRSGAGAAPLDAAGHVLTMLAMSRVDEPYAGLAQVRAACEPADLAEFAWSLFGLWQAVGLPPKHSWILDAQGLLGDDETVRRLAPLIRAWPGERGNARAVAGLDVLAAIGTDVALMHLHGIAQKVRFRALREKANEKIDEVAAHLGLTTDQLADRLVPDLGLGDPVLDYGPRTFTIGLDEHLKPYVLDADGKRRTDPPKPAASDDPELAPAAHKRFAALKKDARTLATDQVRRLEWAMVAQRAWTLASFEELLVSHPVLIHVVSRLIWTAGPISLRVAEDRTYADADDEPVLLSDNAEVRLAHPLILGREQTAAWAGLLAEYEILQPFPQLARETYEEAPATLVGRTAPTLKLLSLEAKGWRRDRAGDAAMQTSLELDLGNGATATLDIEPGIPAYDPSEEPEQTIAAVTVTEATPLIRSEVTRDLRSILT